MNDVDNDKILHLKVVPKTPNETEEYTATLPDADDFAMLCGGARPQGIIVACLNEHGHARFYTDGLDGMDTIALSAMMHRAALNNVEVLD